MSRKNQLNFSLSDLETSKFKTLAATKRCTMTDLLREMIDKEFRENYPQDQEPAQQKTLKFVLDEVRSINKKLDTTPAFFKQILRVHTTAALKTLKQYIAPPH